MNAVGWIVWISMVALISESVPYLSDPDDVLLRSGDSGQLTCSGSNVSWYSAADDSVAIGNGSNLIVSTAGSYYCRVVHGTTLLRSCPAHVSLTEFIPPPNSENKTMSVHRTNDIILSSCQHVHSIPSPTIRWLFNNEMSFPKSTVVLPSGNLLISNFVYKTDIGKYYCIASNNVTNDEWRSPTITLERGRANNEGGISFHNTSLNVTATVGQSVVLECAPAGGIGISVTWIPMPSNGLVYNERYGGVLRIDNVALSNEGVYNCSYMWINSSSMSSINGSRQFHLTVKDHPKITNLTVVQNSSTAIFNCSFTGHPTPNIMWRTPLGVTSVTDGTTLVVTRLGSEAAGIYQCLITNDIGCDRGEIIFSVPSINITTSSSASIASADSSIIDTSSTDVLSPTPSSSASDSLLLSLTSHTSSSASIGPISSVMSHTSSSSASVGPISSVISHASTSSAFIGPISSVISHTSSSTPSIGPISSVISHTSLSSVSIGLILSVISHTSSSSAPIGPISSVISHTSTSSASISSSTIVMLTDTITSQTPSVSSQVYDTTILSSSAIDLVSSPIISHTPSVVTSYISTSSLDVLTMITSHTSFSSMASHSPTSTLNATSNRVSLSRTSSTTTIKSDAADRTSTEITSTAAAADTSSTTVVLSTSSASPAPSSTTAVLSTSSASLTPSSTTAVLYTSSPSPVPLSTTAVLSTSSASLAPSSTTTVLSTSSASPAPSSTTAVLSTSSASTSSATPTPSPTPSVGVPVTMVTEIEFTWIEGDVVKVQWDPITNENILGYKISWDSKKIEPPTAAITATNMSEYEIKLMDNVVDLYIYIWTYNFEGDGPMTLTSIVRPITNLRCENITIWSARVDWTMLAPVSKYLVTTHCSRTGNTMTLEIDGEEVSSEASLILESLEFDCIYDITIKPEGYNDYSLQCIMITAEPAILFEIPKNQSFVDGFWIHWKLHNFEGIPSNLILIVLHIGDQTWEISDPLSLTEFIELNIMQERTELNVTITVSNVWTITETVVVTTDQPTEPGSTDSATEDSEENSLTWIFYIVAFGSVVLVVLLVIISVVGLKHVQIRRREFDKITNHREKIMASLKNDNNVANGRSASDPPKYVVV